MATIIPNASLVGLSDRVGPINLCATWLMPFMVFLFLAGCHQEHRTVKPEVEEVGLPDHALKARSDSLISLAKLYDSLKKDSASFYYQESIRLKEEISIKDTSLIRFYIVTAKFFQKQLKYGTADGYLEKARLLVNDSIVPVSTMIDLYISSANCKENLQDYTVANSLLNKASQLIQRHFPTDSLRRLNVYHSLGTNSFYQNNFYESAIYFQKSIDLIPSGNDQLFGREYLAIGMSLDQQNKFSEALGNYRKSIRARLRWAGPNSEAIANVCTQIFDTFLSLGMKDSALFYLNKNLQIRRKINGAKDIYTYGAHFSLGQYFYKQSNYDSALHHFQESLNSLIISFNDHRLVANPKPTNAEIDINLINGLVWKASAIEKLGSHDAVRNQYLHTALKTFLLADSSFSILRSSSPFDEQKLKQLESNLIPYPKMVGICANLYESTQNKNYLSLAFNVMERSRAALLRVSLNQAEEYNSAGIGDEYRQSERVLGREYATILHQLSNKALTVKARDSLNNTILQVSNRQAKLRIKFRDENPNYFTINYGYANLDLNEVQEFLKNKKSVLLEYLWGEQKLYAIALGRDWIKTKTLDQSPEMISALTEFRNQLKSPERSFKRKDFIKFCSNSSYLHSALIEDLLEGVEANSSLIISADGPLTTFPFEALITQFPDTLEIDYHLPYLFLSHPVSYTYSFDILINQSSIQRKGNKLIAFGYAGEEPNNDLRNGHKNLPGTELEIKAIESVMDNSINKYLLKDEASESFFKSEVSGFDIAHLAIHGEADTSNTLNSHLIFRTDHDSVNDGLLYAHELYDLDLSDLDLAVLSACETGVGRLQSGEGVMSIARGFAYSGCPSQILSLWKIDDMTSAKVMSLFYKNIKGGRRLDYALARAKSDYILQTNEFNSHPFYWAAFLQVGNTQELDVEKPNWLSWVWVIGVTIVILFLRRRFLRG